MTVASDQPRFRVHLHPCAAPPVFPFPGHRTMAQVMAAEATSKRRAMRMSAPVLVLHDYGSPFAVRRTGE